MKKAFDQTVRDLKREVNKKVLKVPSIEQKVLDATSNEPWGPHGTLLADIAQATRNYHEYQMIMTVIWKRINDTGKNWRHVYKALTVLDYLVAHGSERVIDEIREHAYQIQTLSDFQYIDSSGRDQGSNVRKKSQSLVVLVNDKERIQEVRQKAAANRDKFRNTSMGNMYRPGSYSSSGGYGDRYDDDRYDGRYGNRDDDRNGYGREREYGYRDDDRYGRYGDPYSGDRDRYGTERYSRDDEYRGRSSSVDGYQYGSRSRSADRDRDRTNEDDGQYSRRLERKYSEQNLGAPPSYEDAVGVTQSPSHSERDGETPSVSVPKPTPAISSASQPTSTAVPSPVHASPPTPVDNNESIGSDEFDPRGSFSAAPTSAGAAPTISGDAEVDLFGSLSDSLALVPVTPVTAASEAETSINSGTGSTFEATSSQASVSHQTFDDPFGDGPFKAIPSTSDSSGRQQSSISSSSFPKAETVTSSGGSFPDATYTPDPSIGVLAEILPPTGPQQLVNPQAGFLAPTNPPISQPGFLPQTGQHLSPAAFISQSGPTAPQTGLPGQHVRSGSLSGFPDQSGRPSLETSVPAQLHQSQSAPSLTGFATQAGQASQTAAQVAQPSPVPGFPPHMGPFSQAGFQTFPSGQSAQPNAVTYGGYNLPPGSATPVGQQHIAQVFNGPAAQQNPSANLPRSGSGVPVASQMALPATALQPSKDKFETKSSVWADTLNRGLVNLNISGPKTNPLSDIGVDFDTLNRKEKRMEKPSASPVVSTVTMGKAMGSGSGMGRAGSGALRPQPNPMMGAAIGMAGVPRPGMGTGGYAGMNQPVGMNMQANMGIGMNMGMGGRMQQPTGFPPGSSIAGGYNPMTGANNYYQQPPGRY